MQVTRVHARRVNIGPAWSARRPVHRAEFFPVTRDTPALHPAARICDKLSALMSRPLRILCVGEAWEAAQSQLLARGAIVHKEPAIDSAMANLPRDCDLALVEGHSASARSSLHALATSVGAVVVATARKSSPGETRTAAWLGLRDAYAFVHEVVEAPLGRPDTQMWFASNRYWLLSDEIGAFDEFRSEPHSAAGGAHEGTRHHYLRGGRPGEEFVFE